MATDQQIIVVTGLRETIQDLKKFDKDALRRFRKVINTELRGMQKEAVAEVFNASTHGSGAPMSGWYSTAKIHSKERSRWSWFSNLECRRSCQ